MQKVRLLSHPYMNNEQIKTDFINGVANDQQSYFFTENQPNQEVTVESELPYFPIYMARGTAEQKKKDYIEAVTTIINHYIHIDRGLRFDGIFWHSLVVGRFNQEVLAQYGELIEKNYQNIVMKQFDWENYIYKAHILADYLYSNGSTTTEAIERGINLFIDNQDISNYLLKTPVMRNGQFFFNFLEAVDELKFSKTMRARIDYMDKKDDRIGRIIIREFMFEYPMNLITVASKETLKEEIVKKYHHLLRMSH